MLSFWFTTNTLRSASEISPATSTFTASLLTQELLLHKYSENVSFPESLLSYTTGKDGGEEAGQSLHCLKNTHKLPRQARALDGDPDQKCRCMKKNPAYC